jgi:hypothetical protein
MIEIKAGTRPWSDAIEIYILDKTDNQLRSARNVVMEPVERGQWIEPSLNITKDAAQSLMDQLWNCGLRPTEGSGSAGSLAATERHLRDMQAIATGLLRKDGVQIDK